jgi:Fur family transcriptional regulator, ferric uptake regulator
MTFEKLKEKQDKYLLHSSMKSTQERDFILKVVWQLGRAVCGKNRCQRCGDCRNGGRHFSVDDIYEILQKKKFFVSQSTVYRTLVMFCKGEIIQFAFKRNGKAVYELHCNKPHDHLTCVRCGKIVEFSVPETDALHRKLCEYYGFKEIDHLHCIRGICDKCQKINKCL